MFATEDEMAENTISLLITNFYSEAEKLSLVKEPKGLFGVPDLLIFNDGELIAIEFKLKNWKRALQQAFRYRTFSFQSYVYLDQDYINSALNNIEEFKHFNIGLCGVTKDNIEIYYKPQPNKPFSCEMQQKAIELISTNT